MKLKVKLTIIIALMMTMVIAIISIVLLRRATSLQSKAVYQNMENEAGLLAMTLQARYQRYYDYAMSITYVFKNYESYPVERRRDEFNTILYYTLKANPNFVGLYSVWLPGVIDGQDEVFANTEGTDASGNYMPWFTQEDSGAIELHAYSENLVLYRSTLNSMSAIPIINNPTFRTLQDKKILVADIIVPIIRSDNQIVGIVGISINLTSSQTLVRELKPYGTGYATLYATDGTIIAHPDTARIGQNFEQASLATIGQVGILTINESLINGKPAIVEHNGLLIQSYPFHTGNTVNNWTIMSVVETKMVFATVRAMSSFTIVFVIITIIMSGIIVFFVATKIAKPIIFIARTLKDISEGEGDLTQKINVINNDETGELAYYFNCMLEKIKELITMIKKQSAILFDIGTELAAHMSETASAVNEITTNIQNIKSRVINQSASVTETNATMEQISLNIGKLNTHIEQQTEDVSQSSSAIEEMLENIRSVTQTLGRNVENVKKLSEASDRGHSSLQEVATDIQEIARESEGLLEINAVMENIASQTNLLSMNAAIEAAHAGEAGRGFAVVADEIRKLAESSSEQSKTIAKVLGKIKESIDKIMASTDEVIDKFEAINDGVKTVSEQEEHIRNAMEEQATGSKQILEAISRLNEMTDLVRNGSAEMLEGSQEVIKESKRLAVVTAEIESSISDMAVNANQINTAVSQVNSISGENKHNIDILVEEVSHFKVE
ncbi:MAG: methyl-accepting chemotaxis protein [Spirochaetaceae bacterium]|nr:methyl-accepting chemotaxis protein [Spirochaetaceae bacterium]